MKGTSDNYLYIYNSSFSLSSNLCHNFQCHISLQVFFYRNQRPLIFCFQSKIMIVMGLPWQSVVKTLYFKARV